MPESPAHNRAKNKAAGKSGKTEVRLKDGRRIDAKTPKKATEVERSGSPKRLKQSAKRLKDSNASQKILQVPQKDMPKAVEAMKEVGIGGTVKNIGNTKKQSVPKS